MVFPFGDSESHSTYFTIFQVEYLAFFYLENQIIKEIAKSLSENRKHFLIIFFRNILFNDSDNNGNSWNEYECSNQGNKH